MKPLIYVCIAFATIFVSCDDYLNTVPPDKASPETFLKNVEQARSLLAGVYNTLYDDGDWAMRPYVYDCMSDNAYNPHPWEYSSEFAKGTQSPNSNWAYYKWRKDWLCIARCNSLLRGLQGSDLSESEKKQIEAEVRFLRSLSYYDLICFYGRVPLLDENTPQENQARSPIADVLTFMHGDVQFAIDNLPHTFDAGVANKAAAWMLKLRIAQYEKDNPAVIDCAQAIKRLGYSLYGNFKTLFLDEGIEDPANKEVIFKVNYSFEYRSSHITKLFYNWGSFQPTLAAVNSFFTINGRPIRNLIAQNGETIERDVTYDPSFPFRNRDPRLKMSILCPGDEFRIDALQWISNPWVPKAVGESKTGFLTRKGVNESLSNLSRDGTDKILMRYGEVLLSWAESENEVNGPAGAYPLIDELRARVGMISLSQSLPNLTKATMRELIRNERRIELFIEGQRWFDIRRWGIAEEVMTNAEGLDISKMTYFPTNGGTSEYWQYVPMIIDERLFNKDRDYLWPIPMNELIANPLISEDQNPGYN